MGSPVTSYRASRPEADERVVVGEPAVGWSPPRARTGRRWPSPSPQVFPDERGARARRSRRARRGRRPRRPRRRHGSPARSRRRGPCRRWPAARAARELPPAAGAHPGSAAGPSRRPAAAARSSAPPSCRQLPSGVAPIAEAAVGTDEPRRARPRSRSRTGPPRPRCRRPARRRTRRRDAGAPARGTRASRARRARARGRGSGATRACRRSRAARCPRASSRSAGTCHRSSTLYRANPPVTWSCHAAAGHPVERQDQELARVRVAARGHPRHELERHRLGELRRLPEPAPHRVGRRQQGRDRAGGDLLAQRLVGAGDRRHLAERRRSRARRRARSRPVARATPRRSPRAPGGTTASRGVARRGSTSRRRTARRRVCRNTDIGHPPWPRFIAWTASM